MQNGWGILVVVIGLLMALGGMMRSDFAPYRLLVARSRGLWGERVHAFYIVAGLSMTIFGAVIVLWKR